MSDIAGRISLQELVDRMRRSGPPETAEKGLREFVARCRALGVTDPCDVDAPRPEVAA